MHRAAVSLRLNHTDDMASIKDTFRTLQERRRRRRATLPWPELEAEAMRQGCSAADIFFDCAGRPVPGLPPVREGPPAHAAGLAPIPPNTHPGYIRKPTYDTWGGPT
jgi:hypothetical protein